MATTAAFTSSPRPSFGAQFRALIQTLRLSFTLLTFLFFSTAVTAEISYSSHCYSTVPESNTTTLSTSVRLSYFQFDSGSFTGADEFLPSSSYNSFRFSPFRIYDTRSPGVFNIQASLYFRGAPLWVMNGIDRRLLRLVNESVPWVNRRRMVVKFSLDGFWSEETGKVCMVGTGWTRRKEGTQNFDLSAVFKLLYFPKSSNLTTVMVSGTLESLDTVGSNGYFSPVKMLVYAPHDYQYSLINKAESFFGNQLDDSEEAVALEGDRKICGLLNSFVHYSGFQLEYASECQGNNCSPLGESVAYLPRLILLKDIKCSEGGLLHLYLTFSNFTHFGGGALMEPDLMLVGEGLWEKKRNLLKIVACRVLSSNETATGDCTIGVSLWFPKYLSFTNRSVISGRIWSNQGSNSTGYFKKISFHDMGDYMGRISGTSYKYTQAETLQKTCSNRATGKSGRKTYPNLNSPRDMRFDISVKNVDGKSFWGSATPVSLGQTIYDNIVMGDGNVPLPSLAELNQSLWNVSYRIAYSYRNTFVDISTEGIYNTETGALCMIGCLSSIFYSDNYLKKLNSTDCSVTIDIQLSSLYPEKGEHITGTIRSTRQKVDPLYFKPLLVSSYDMYVSQAVETISRMDIEIMMVLVSLTLMCVFTGLQLFHVKRHPHVLPSISLTMLITLTVGHMIPLILTFETFITSRNKQSNMFQSGGWLEVKEVTVRVVTMIAFLLQCRLLQLGWSSRTAETKNFKIGERRTSQLCLPLYFAGALIAWFVHTRSQKPLPREIASLEVHSSLWEEMISYAGLLLDGFLLPQIILNLFSNSKEKSLALIFYVGTTVVRAMPHLYDAYRTHHYVPYSTDSYIYGSPDGDFYSTAWDIIIPCGGVLFAFILYLQQRFGSTCILPSRFKEQGGYEMVPIANS